MNKIPHADEQSNEFFRAVFPESDPHIKVRPMFGNFAAFVNGNMFAGLFGDDMFVRLSDEGRVELLKVKGTKIFESMKGRPMKEYILFPRAWKKNDGEKETVRSWISRSLEWARKLPAKKKS